MDWPTRKKTTGFHSCVSQIFFLWRSHDCQISPKCCWQLPENLYYNRVWRRCLPSVRFILVIISLTRCCFKANWCLQRKKKKAIGGPEWILSSTHSSCQETKVVSVHGCLPSFWVQCMAKCCRKTAPIKRDQNIINTKESIQIETWLRLNISEKRTNQNWTNDQISFFCNSSFLLHQWIFFSFAS